MNPARTRIGRVIMKAGGADLRVLHQNPASLVVSRMRGWANEAAEFSEPPTGFVGVAYWHNDDGLRRPYLVGWETVDPDLPLPNLMQQAAAQIANEAAILIAEHRVMRRLGYHQDDAS